ncbi:MAG: 16S rRNA (cytosine(967)-C(5))-methyltransferase RsmB [Selenomonadaceae bacterium]|nr:16S rRNA (cytosine(967)-C(5))-methyltransferase RsmB [Selenomonadaceae bacterium]MBR4384468.1 16S rRNA (cytosine(967)-C(5))-methyltransferase RsmB [Selenomonadaceae bacterium]
MDKIRLAATKIVFEVSKNGAWANVVLAQTLRQEKFDDRDRKFCTELVYGTIKAGASLDWKISKYVNRPLKKVDAKVLAVLRVGMYQIFFLDRVPNSAAVNESTELTKKFCSQSAAKFVNGVLRSAVREPTKSDFPTGDDVESLALRTFHPAQLVKMFVEEFGLDATKKILDFDNTDPPLCLRVNFLRTTREKILDALKKFDVQAEPSTFAPEGIICRGHGALDKFRPLRDGLCQVQDESSMSAARFLNPRAGEFVIDCCAAPGGKSTHMAELMQNRGRIVAADIYETKIEHIKQNAERLGIKIIEPLLIDARELGKKFPAQVDKVLVDAPCSGLGVLRRKADMRWKNLAEIDALPTLQTEILSSAAETLKHGGILVYSTCTILKCENQSVVENFLSTHKDFELVETKIFLPHVTNTDGFFAAKMIRR